MLRKTFVLVENHKGTVRLKILLKKPFVSLFFSKQKLFGLVQNWSPRSPAFQTLPPGQEQDEKV